MSVFRPPDEWLREYNARRGGKAPKTTESPALKAVTDTGRVFPASGTIRPSKYRSRRCGAYASVKEARRAAELKLRLAAGEIRDLREQVPFLLIPKQQQGNTSERECRYIADFVYEEKSVAVVGPPLLEIWTTVVEDVKSDPTKTPEFRIKKKLMLYVHGIALRMT